ncbi:hypothetical protein [Actinoplanes sp. G11-F43]|uniref:hypothetical protein n=1 Tax=Actinoplanes sp. G11-F43 TaxID=3424130 RepID=UPI003D33F958
MQPTVSAAEASQRVQQLVEEAFAQLPPGASLVFNDGSDVGPCEGAMQGRVFAEKRYRIVVEPGSDWPADRAIPTLVAFWEKAGYQLHDDRRQERWPRYVVRTPDDFSVNIAGWDRGDHFDYTLTSSSPCVWENGTPNPG